MVIVVMVAMVTVIIVVVIVVVAVIMMVTVVPVVMVAIIMSIVMVIIMIIRVSIVMIIIVVVIIVITVTGAAEGGGVMVQRLLQSIDLPLQQLLQRAGEGGGCVPLLLNKRTDDIIMLLFISEPYYGTIRLAYQGQGEKNSFFNSVVPR